MNPDAWDRARWHQEADSNDVMVMTPAILHHVLQCGFLQVCPPDAVHCAVLCCAVH
jgi:hypothetical protein